MANIQRRRVPITIPSCSANFMKMLGVIVMSLYLFGQSILQHGILGMTDMKTTGDLDKLLTDNYEAFNFAGTATVCGLLGAGIIPVFALLIGEGVRKTANIKKYILLVFITAVVTEIPYDFAVSGKLFNWEDQSFLWTLLFAIITLWLLNSFRGKGALGLFVNALIIGGGCIWEYFAKCRFGLGFVLMAGILFILWEDHKGVGIFLGIVISIFMHKTIPLGFFPVALYNGYRKDTDKKISKYGYYIACPTIAIVFGLMANFVVQRIQA